MNNQSPPKDEQDLEIAKDEMRNLVESFITSDATQRDIIQNFPSAFEITLQRESIHNTPLPIIIIYHVIVDECWQRNGIFNALRYYLEEHDKVGAVAFHKTTNHMLIQKLPQWGYRRITTGASTWIKYTNCPSPAPEKRSSFLCKIWNQIWT